MKFKRIPPEEQTGEYDDEWLSDCGHYGLCVLRSERPRCVLWQLDYKQGLVGRFDRRRDAVAKAEELRQGKINEIVKGMVTP